MKMNKEILEKRLISFAINIVEIVQSMPDEKAQITLRVNYYVRAHRQH